MNWLKPWGLAAIWWPDVSPCLSQESYSANASRYEQNPVTATGQTETPPKQENNWVPSKKYNMRDSNLPLLWTD